MTDGAGNVVTYGYDADSNITCMSYPNSGSTTCQNSSSGTGLVTYAYDGAGQEISMTDWLGSGNVTSFGYDLDGNLTKITYPAGTTTSASDSYDNADALTDTSYTIGSTTTNLAALTRNADELIGSTTPPSGGGTTYGYDSLNRVTTGTTASYTYDAASELTSVTPSGGSATDFAYNTDGQLCWTGSSTGSCASPPTGATTFSYSSVRGTPEHHTVGIQPHHLWLGPGRQSGVRDSPQWFELQLLQPPQHRHHHLRLQRRRSAHVGHPRRGIDPAVHLGRERLGAPAARGRHQLLPLWARTSDRPRSSRSASVARLRRYLVSDTTGVREQIGSTGSVVGSMSYDSYGNRCSTCSISTPFGFEGGYTDATELVYLVHRYYDPATEQFLSVDPLVDETGTPYAFTGGDPVNGSDPTGLGPICVFGVCLGFHPGNALKGLANFGARLANFAVSTATLGHVHVPQPFCGGLLGISSDIGNWTGFAEAGLAGGAAGAAETGAADTRVIVNLGGEGEVPDAINVQPARIGGNVDAGLANARRVASESGQPVVMAEGNSLPFGTGSVDEVWTNNVPIGKGNGYFGPDFDPGEIFRNSSIAWPVVRNSAP